MQATVFRQFYKGRQLPSEQVRASFAHQGELELRVRVTGRHGAQDTVYLAMLMARDFSYVLPPLDNARLVNITGRWLQLVGIETLALSRSYKSLKADRYPQAWWCRIDGAAVVKLHNPADDDPYVRTKVGQIIGVKERFKGKVPEPVA